jgi:hypothetical protein
VMYRLLEESGEPTKKQASGKSIRPRAARKKGRPAGGACDRRGVKHPP